MKSTTTTTCSDCHSVTGERKCHKHIWMYSTFCDTCNCDFDTWLQEEKEEVARRLVIDDFNHMVCVMADEGKFDRQVAVEIYTQMRELARARGYLRYPSYAYDDGRLRRISKQNRTRDSTCHQLITKV